MNTKEVKNVVASVLARLRNTSKSNGVPFQQVLQQYAMERFLYRVSKSRHAQSVILKGALLLKTIGIPNARPTMDIDMLRKGKADEASLVALIKDCATLEVEADGLTFLDNTVAAEEITKDSEYKGTRILMDARMDNVRLRLQIDFGVGDRETSVPAQEFEALTATFAGTHRVQWNAFVRKMGEEELIDGFGKIIEDIKTFAMPAFRSLASGEKIAQQWKAGNGWVIS